MITPPDGLSLPRLMRARAFMAQVVRIHGEKYWPLFEKLDRECEACEKRQQRMQDILTNGLPVGDTGNQIRRKRQSDFL